jgi:hypothetical protein
MYWHTTNMKYTYHDSKGEHLHEIDGRPLIGTSTVVGVLSKPLTWWASGLAVTELGWVKELTAYSKPKPTKEEIEANKQQRLESAGVHLLELKAMEPESFVKLLDKAYKAHSVKLDKAADKVTDMHEELEQYVNDCMLIGEIIPPDEKAEHPAVKIFAEWAIKNVKRFIASEAHCYSERLWTGGITDCVAELNNGELAIIDFKSSKEAYISQFIQCAGYDIAASENGLFNSDGDLICKLEKEIDCYIVFPFGATKVEPATYVNVDGARKGFESAVCLYKLINI